MVFDFPRWRSWTEQKGPSLESVAPMLKFDRNDEYLPGFSLEMIGSAALGSFRCYSNGLVDFEVIDKRTNALMANRAMIEVSDDNFEPTFNAFVSEFEKVN